MIKENVLEIKKLVSDLHCMGTYGMVELELTKIENYVKELEGKVENLTIPVVSQRSELLKFLKWLDLQYHDKHYPNINEGIVDNYIKNFNCG